MEFYEEFGRRVRAARDVRQLTQEELALRLGLSRAAVASIETGRQRVTLDVLPRVARFLGVDPVELLPDLGPAESPGHLIKDLTAREREVVDKVWKRGTRQHRTSASSASS